MTSQQKLTVVWIITIIIVFRVLPDYIGPNKKVPAAPKAPTADHSISTNEIVEAIQSGEIRVEGVNVSLSSAGFDSNEEVMAGAIRLFELEKPDSADYLDAKDKAQELITNYKDFIQYQIVRMNMSAVVQIATDNNERENLYTEILLPLSSRVSCDFSKRTIIESEQKNLIHFYGNCPAYGEFQGRYNFDTNYYYFVITPSGKSAQFHIVKLNEDQAMLMEVESRLKPAD